MSKVSTNLRIANVETQPSFRTGGSLAYVTNRVVHVDHTVDVLHESILPPNAAPLVGAERDGVILAGLRADVPLEVALLDARGVPRASCVTVALNVGVDLDSAVLALVVLAHVVSLRRYG